MNPEHVTDIVATLMTESNYLPASAAGDCVEVPSPDLTVHDPGSISRGGECSLATSLRPRFGAQD